MPGSTRRRRTLHDEEEDRPYAVGLRHADYRPVVRVVTGPPDSLLAGVDLFLVCQLPDGLYRARMARQALVCRMLSGRAGGLTPASSWGKGNATLSN